MTQNKFSIADSFVRAQEHFMRVCLKHTVFRPLSTSLTISKYTLNLLLGGRSLAKINTIPRQDVCNSVVFSEKLQKSLRCHWMLSKKIVNNPIQGEILFTHKDTCRTEGFFIWGRTIEKPAKHCLNKKQGRCFVMGYYQFTLCSLLRVFASHNIKAFS